MDQVTDAREVEAAIGGDAEALQRVWRTHRRWVAAVLLAHKPREAELEDLLQEVACTVVERIGEIRDPACFRAWLRSVSMNAARTAGRRATTRRIFRSMRMQGVTDMPGPSAEPAPDADHHGEASRLLEIARRLHPDYSEPLLLRAVRGLSQKQIAETLGLPETTIETRLARARKMLREELAFERDCVALPISRGRSS
jgi:RNA polymerase sigma-70 factor (ECF subfamily)